MIKVAHIITLLEFGGAQQNTLYTLSRLDRQRFQTLLISGPGGILDEEAGKIKNTGTYFIEDLGRLIRPFKDLKALLEIFRILRKEKPLIVHTHSSKAGILGRLAAFMAGVPVILHTYHGLAFHERLHPLAKYFYIFLEWACSLISTRLIFVSRANRDYALGYAIGRRDKSVLIRSGVPLAFYPAKVEASQKKAELGAGMHKPLVTSVGNFKPQKNPRDFILLAKMVYEKCPEARFLFIGDGDLRPGLESLILRLDLHGKCLLPGWRRDVPEILAASDVFVLTSLWEGLPRSLVEAMKTGLPCVAYATDGVRDIVRDGENGFLASPGNVSEMAEKVTALLKDQKLREETGRKASESIGPEFDIDEMVRRQEELYESLVEVLQR